MTTYCNDYYYISSPIEPQVDAFNIRHQRQDRTD